MDAIPWDMSDKPANQNYRSTPIKNSWHSVNVVVAKEKPSNEKELIEKIAQAWQHLITFEKLLQLCAYHDKALQSSKSE